MTLKDLIASDIKNVFCKNDDEFCDKLKVGFSSENYGYYYGSLQSNEVQNNSGNNSPLVQFSHTLHIEAAPFAGVNFHAGMAIYVEDRAYKIVDSREEMGMLEMHLKRG